jgi:hypothetical protein
MYSGSKYGFPNQLLLYIYLFGTYDITVLHSLSFKNNLLARWNTLVSYYSVVQEQWNTDTVLSKKLNTFLDIGLFSVVTLHCK